MERTPVDTGTLRRSRPRPQNGAAIRSLREKDGYDQSAFAKEIGLSQSAMSNIERETKSARISTLNKIARQLRVPVAAIMRDEMDENAA